MENIATKHEVEFVISTVAEHNIDIKTITSVFQVMPKYNFLWDIGAISGYSRSKNSKWTNFLLETEIPYLIHIDRDMEFPVSAVDMLLEDMQDGYDLIGATYPTREGKVLTTWGKGDGGISLNGEIYEVAYIAQGFCGLSRRLLQRLVDELKLVLLDATAPFKQYPFCMEGTVNDPDFGQMWMSEDYYFCNLCKKIGIKPMLDTRIRVGHSGEMTWYPEHTIAFQGDTDRLNVIRKQNKGG